MEEKWLVSLRQVVKKHLPSGYQAFVFGSRADGSNRQFSDIDLGIEGKQSLPNASYVKIQEALEESDLPYRVDLVDFADLTSQFKKIALRSTIPL